MAPQSKVVLHPDRELIISWLTSGESVREVENRLAQKYPLEKDAHLRISASTLQAFRKEFLNLSEKTLEDIKDVASLTTKQIQHDVIQAEIEQSSAYKSKINALLDTRLDIQKEMVKTFSIMEDRIEALYNKSKENKEYIDGRTERVLLGYIEQLRGLFVDYRKYIDNVGVDNQQNISVTIIDTQIGVVREAVREVLADVDPMLAVKFMEMIKKKMAELKYHQTDENGMYLGDGKNG